MMQMTAIAPSPRTKERAQSSVVKPLAPGGVGEVVVGLTMRVLFEVGADVGDGVVVMAFRVRMRFVI